MDRTAFLQSKKEAAKPRLFVNRLYCPLLSDGQRCYNFFQKKVTRFETSLQVERIYLCKQQTVVNSKVGLADLQPKTALAEAVD